MCISIVLFVQVLKRRGVADKHLPTSREEASVLIKLLLNIRSTSSSAEAAAECQVGARKGERPSEAGKPIVSASASGVSADFFAHLCVHANVRACADLPACP